MSSLIKLLRYTKQYWPNIILSIVTMVIDVIAGFIVIRLTPVLIDEALPNLDMPLLLETGGIMLGVALIGVITGIINTINSQRVAMYATADLRHDLFEKIESSQIYLAFT